MGKPAGGKPPLLGCPLNLYQAVQDGKTRWRCTLAWLSTRVVPGSAGWENPPEVGKTQLTSKRFYEVRGETSPLLTLGKVNFFERLDFENDLASRLDLFD